MTTLNAYHTAGKTPGGFGWPGCVAPATSAACIITDCRFGLLGGRHRSVISATPQARSPDDAQAESCQPFDGLIRQKCVKTSRAAVKPDVLNGIFMFAGWRSGPSLVIAPRTCGTHNSQACRPTSATGFGAAAQAMLVAFITQLTATKIADSFPLVTT